MEWLCLTVFLFVGVLPIALATFDHLERMRRIELKARREEQESR